MTARGLFHWIILGLLALPLGLPAQAGVPDTAEITGTAVQVVGFDPVHTAFGFELRTRWGHRVRGRFPEYDGALVILPDGRRRIRIRLSAAAVDVGSSERYTAIARGEGFFDAERYPDIEFVSELHDDTLRHEGGPLRGRLTMHGVSRMETFVVAPAICERAGDDCDAVATGSVDRNDYGIDGLRLMLSDRVRFTMRVRLQHAEPSKDARPSQGTTP